MYFVKHDESICDENGKHSVIVCDTVDNKTELVSVEFCRKAAISVLGISDSVVKSVSNREISEYLMSRKVLLCEPDIDYKLSVWKTAEAYLYTCYGNCKEYNIPYGIEGICATAFICCEDVERIVLPETVTYIGERAFYGCTSLKVVEMPSELDFIGTWAFARTAKDICFICRHGVSEAVREYASSFGIKIVEL